MDDRPEEHADELRVEGRRLASVIALAFGGMMHAIVGVFVFSSGLLAPGWAVVGLLLVWALSAIQMWRWRRLPLLVLAIPLVMAGIWWVAITLGERLLGWTA